ncbi:MAG: homocysteine S-methyltransferase family protein [Bryobacteraceae bacterium]|nr:homocysteine S-methyltransferase family protein [Bryobacteraceae bacterium]MCX7603096.1 homocysteine S-methyltransferase family protein [Bryobacteraceae bacterium]
MPRLDAWTSRGVVITDGAWGTRLQALGLEPGTLPDSWNLTHPELVLQVAREYVEAGSEVILTNTFRANAITLAGAGLADRAWDINRAGVEISRRAAQGRALVFASIGPTGKMLMTGEAAPEELERAFAGQAEALALAGADALLVETMSDLEEARIAARAALATGLPVIVSFAFDTGRNRDRTMMGVTPEMAAAEMRAAGVDAVGANCGAGIERFVPLCARLKASSGLPVWIKANAGLPEWKDGRAVYSGTPEQFAAHLAPLAEAGAAFIGGCCGTTPDFVRALVAAREAM